MIYSEMVKQRFSVVSGVGCLKIEKPISKKEILHPEKARQVGFVGQTFAVDRVDPEGRMFLAELHKDKSLIIQPEDLSAGGLFLPVGKQRNWGGRGLIGK